MGEHSSSEVPQKRSNNPLHYSIRQLYKALMAWLSSMGILLGLVVVVMVDDPYKQIGLYAAAALAVLNPIVVFLKRADPIITPMLPNTPIIKEGDTLS